jgi:hypothetical protein
VVQVATREVRALRALHELTLLAALLLTRAALARRPGTGAGASLRGGRQLPLPDGYRAEVLPGASAFRRTLAVDPPHGVWGPGPARLPAAIAARACGPRAPRWASAARREPAPRDRPPVRFGHRTFRGGQAWRGIPDRGDLYVAEARGHHLFRVTAGRPVHDLRSRRERAGRRSRLVFDATGRLLVLDPRGRACRGHDERPTPRPPEKPGESYQGRVHWAPRRRDAAASPATSSTPASSSRRPPFGGGRRVLLGTAVSAAFASGDLVASGSNGVDRPPPTGRDDRSGWRSSAGRAPSWRRGPDVCMRSTTWAAASRGSGPVAPSSHSSRGSIRPVAWPTIGRGGHRRRGHGAPSSSSCRRREPLPGAERRSRQGGAGDAMGDGRHRVRHPRAPWRC